MAFRSLKYTYVGKTNADLDKKHCSFLQICEFVICGFAIYVLAHLRNCNTYTEYVTCFIKVVCIEQAGKPTLAELRERRVQKMQNLQVGLKQNLAFPLSQKNEKF